MICSWGEGKAINWLNHFICEQEGHTETEFKEALCAIFLQHSEFIRAHLAQVKYNVALCLKVEDDNNHQLLHQAMSIFKSMFGKNEHLDIIFLTDRKELELRKVCCPFFISKEYQIKIPDFYLISSEGYDLNEPIACFKRKYLQGKYPDGYLLCDISPPLQGEPYKINLSNINQLVLAQRHQNYSLFPIKDWPAYVHVAVPLNTL